MTVKAKIGRLSFGRMGGEGGDVNYSRRKNGEDNQLGGRCFLVWRVSLPLSPCVGERVTME